MFCNDVTSNASVLPEWGAGLQTEGADWLRPVLHIRGHVWQLPLDWDRGKKAWVGLPRWNGRRRAMFSGVAISSPDHPLRLFVSRRSMVKRCRLLLWEWNTWLPTLILRTSPFFTHRRIIMHNRFVFVSFLYKYLTQTQKLYKEIATRHTTG